MKTKLLKTLIFITATLCMVSCSDDESIKADTAASSPFVSASRSTVWAGTIGYVDANGNGIITADQSLITADFEEELAKRNTPTTIKQLQIVRQTLANDPSDFTYGIIGSDLENISIGVILDVVSTTSAGAQLGVSGQFDSSSMTGCRGCGTGCNLRYVKIQGKKVYYCNENGCGAFCTEI